MKPNAPNTSAWTQPLDKPRTVRNAPRPAYSPFSKPLDTLADNARKAKRGGR